MSFLLETIQPGSKTIIDISNMDAAIAFLNNKQIALNSVLFSVKVVKKGIKNKYYNYSSEHLAINCQLSNNECGIMNVVFKFLIKTNGNNLTIFHMDDNHFNDIVKKYNLLNMFLKDFDSGTNKTIKINDYYFGKIDGCNIWVEEYLDNFGKFINTNYDRPYLLVSTTSQTLKNLQKHIYTKTKGAYTIFDMQGCSRDILYILADIEFTNTITILGDQIDHYNTLVNYEKNQNLVGTNKR